MKKTDLDLVGIVASCGIAVVFTIGAYVQNGETKLEHYINRRAREERVMQFEKREPQSETTWDYLRGKGDIIVAGAQGLSLGILFYTANRWIDKRRERKMREQLKKECPALYARRYPDDDIKN